MEEKVETKIRKIGGKREGSGRKKGTPNKATADIKKIAQEYGPEAIYALASILRNPENQKAQIAAAKELLDRGYGRALQSIEASGPDGAPIQVQQIAIEFVSAN